MVDKVITMGRTVVTALLRGRESAPIGGDFREIKFTCRFPADAVNGGTPPAPKPQIRVMLSTAAAPHLFEVEIVPPGGNRELLRAGRRQRGQVSWARRAVLEAGRPQVAPRSTSRRAIGTTKWELDDPFGDLGDIVDPVDPTEPGGGGGPGGRRPYTHTRELDPARDEPGTWTVRVRNRSQDDEQVIITVDHPETVQNLRETRIPFQLINRTFAQVLLMMQPRIRIDNGQARIEFDRTFRDLTGIEDQIVSVTDRLKDINLREFKVEIGNEGGIPTITAGLDLEDRGDEFELPIDDIDLENLAITCRVQIVFGYPRGPDFFETAMRRENNQVVRKSIPLFTYLDMNPDISGLWASFLDVILVVAGSSLDDKVQEAIDAVELVLGNAVRKAETLVQDVIMHLVDRDDVLFTISADDDSIVVVHHRRPSVRDFLDLDHDVVSPDDGVDDDVVSPVDGGVVDAGARATAVAVVARDNVSPRTIEELSALPAHAESNPSRRLREGEIDHIVILMMENRSFDHMLGYRHFAHPETNGLTGNESNPFSQGQPYKVHHLSATADIRSPDHGFDATLEQLGGGSMSGFVQNYSRRSGVVDPGLVMSYYDARELPVYEFLANNFAICDAWHSAHPGPTQCNRFAALTGVTPELENFELSDQRLGYYDGATVLDYLTQRGIDWVYAEGNVAFLRMFDRYRIDVSHVIPYGYNVDQDIEDTFVQRVSHGNLPSVSFIDPRFIDIPPAWDANDDLPPADVICGQQLVKDVYWLLSTATTWPKTLLLVTYDEHGGFYDHETPLGMPTARDPRPFPRLHPEGPEHLGVRVPAFVVSPWVDGGTVFHTTYDHTSILKTILQRFAPADFPVAEAFGPRPAAANGLLSEPLRTSARRQPPPVAPDIECEPIGPRGPSADLDSSDFQLSLRLLGLPAKYRDRTTW
jgi:phospholipase C